MKYISTGIALALLSGLSLAEEPKMIEEPASVMIPITRPTEKSHFDEMISSVFTDMKVKDCPVDMQKIDGELQQWFDEQKKDNTDYYQANQKSWDKQIAETKNEARKTVAPVIAQWEKSVDHVREEFRASETAFYEGKPSLEIRATYKYHEGQRDPSGVNPSWIFVPLTTTNTPEILGEDSVESADVVLKTANDSTPIVKFKYKWSTSISAVFEKDQKAEINGFANRPASGCVLYSSFLTKFNKSHTHDLTRFDKSTKSVAVAPNVDLSLTVGNTGLNGSISSGIESRISVPIFKSSIEAGKNLPQ